MKDDVEVVLTIRKLSSIKFQHTSIELAEPFICDNNRKILCVLTTSTIAGYHKMNVM